MAVTNFPTQDLAQEVLGNLRDPEKRLGKSDPAREVKSISMKAKAYEGRCKGPRY